jgi:quercetin dioxygenase-like cupin family protein
MITIFKTVTPRNGHSRFLRLGTTASAAALVLGLIASGSARAEEVSPLQIIPQAQGSTPDKAGNLRVNGPTDVLQALLKFQPSAETGWHIHPGPVVVVVKSGAITETHANGCITVHPAGSVFFERADEVHNAANQTGGVAEVFATFLSPAGAQPLIPVQDPGRVCRAGDDHDRDDRQEDRK